MKVSPYALAWVSVFFSTSTAMTLADPTSDLIESHQIQVRESHQLLARDGDQHEGGGMHMEGPFEEINWDVIWKTHEKDPLSLVEFDRQGGNEEGRGHGKLMAWHIGLMSISWFGFLPLFLFLRTAKHPLAIVPQIGFLSTLALGTITGTTYKKNTPDLYEQEAHSKLAWPILILVLALNIKDILVLSLTLYRRLSGKVLSAEGEKGSWQRDVIALATFWRRGKGNYFSVRQQEVQESQETLLEELEEDNSTGHVGTRQPHQHHQRPRKAFSISSIDTELRESSAFWDPDPEKFNLSKSKTTSALSTTIKFGIIGLERSLLLLGYASFCTGVAVYSGTCRQAYLNGCLAHIIKGSIFFFYGLLSYGRYLGAWSELGWAWNKKPDSHTWRDSFVSAEWVECFMIFIYGATQQFYERRGRSSSDPVTVKDVQHISIAVMMCWVGLLGLLVESKTIKRWLSFSSISRLNHRSHSEVAPPSTHGFSFNPIPALAILITGLAMGGHHQTFKFQMTVHSLWGNFLAGFGLLRLLTYFFLYVNPPTSILPSRPPTELLACFFLTAGGVVFIESTEQVVFAAMTHGFDHIMGFTNLTVAFTAFIFTWQTLLFAIKGWAQLRMDRSEGFGVEIPISPA